MRAHWTYIQCGQRTAPPWGLILEYQEGTIDLHYRAALGPYEPEPVISAMIKYLHGDPSWLTDIGVWEHLDMKKLLRQEARWKREDARRARLTERRGRGDEKQRPSPRRRRPAPLVTDRGPARSSKLGAKGTMRMPDRSGAKPSFAGVLGIGRWLARRIWQWVKAWRRRRGS